jgi:uncharacterized protein (TIGR00159 family)
MNNLLQLLASLQWQDIVDITLNSYILFRFYVLFRGTYVFRVLIGLTMLWFFQQLATMLGLIVTSWVIQGIVAVSAFIIIVVFRNEIRNVLQARNLKSILWGFSPKSNGTPIRMIIDGVFDLARKKCGGLLVLPGREDISELVHSGLSWRGELSPEMILSIFWPDNPVHDGAAIIQGDQVAEVGAILPLSNRSDLPSHFGTRHRAALGLSEASDAIVIVVSEERGDIHLAKRSWLREIRSKKKLEQKLQEHFGIYPGDREEHRRQGLEIATAALVSLMFIAGVWFTVSRGLDALVTLNVPVEYMNRKPVMEIVSASTNSVSVELSGSGALIKSLRPDQVRTRLDLSKATVGKNAFTITADNVTHPPGIILKNITPSEITVELDITIEKQLPVQVDWVGKLPEDLSLVEAGLDPPTVTIVGGKRILDTMKTIYTEKVPLDTLKADGSLVAKLALQPASLKVADGSRDKVTISYVTKKRGAGEETEVPGVENSDL